LLLFLLVLFRFRRRFNHEFARQSQITWPEATALFTLRPIALQKGEKPHANGTTELAEPYHFYSQGAEFTGRQLLPEVLSLRKEEQQRIEQRLNAADKTWKVKYNPKDPQENMLRVGHSGLSWWKVVVYGFFGIVLPLCFVYGIMAYLTDPVAWWDAVSFGTSDQG
ncbi:MAG: hypothetical protein AAF840_05725, partial [Bacteroidota bacterium]